MPNERKNRINHSERHKADWVVILCYLLLTIFGWMNIYAAVYSDAHSYVFDFSCEHGKQLMWIGLSFMTAFALLIIEPKVYINTSYIVYFLIVLILIATLFIGNKTHGGQSWLKLGNIKIQPSEFGKLATALALSKYMSSINLDIKKFKTLAIASIIILVPAALVILQHDMGSALVFTSFLLPLYREGLTGIVLIIALVAVVLFILALLVNKYVMIGIFASIALAYLFLYLKKRTRKDYRKIIFLFLCCSAFTLSVDFVFDNILEQHQKNRVLVLLGKADDPQHIGYNMNQSKIAIGSGGVFGTGYLQGTMTKANFVPEQDTDFIFCTVGEEWGFVGSSVVIAIYIILLVRLITLAERQRATFARFYGYSIASILFFHVLVNIGMVLGLMPVIGIPLPFFSYGGSSLMAFTIMIFTFLRMDTERMNLL